VPTLLVLLPDFAIIALGYLIGKRTTDRGWKQIDLLSYYVFYPALLFTAASQRAVEFKSLLLIGAPAIAIVTTGYALARLAGRYSTEGTVADTGGIAQNAWRFNAALGFVAIAALPDNAVFILAIVVGVSIPMANVYAITLMVSSRVALLKEIMLNPFLLASLAGVSVGITGIHVPSMFMDFSNRLADAAIPVVLLSLGAVLSHARLWPPNRHGVSINAIKLICLPCIVWLSIYAFQWQGTTAAVLLIFSALPTASAAHVLAARYGADRSRVAVCVMQSSFVGLLTLPFWTTVAVGIAAH